MKFPNVKEMCELSCKILWLKSIAKECKKRDKLQEKLNKTNCVINNLVAEYQKIYGKDLRNPD